VRKLPPAEHNARYGYHHRQLRKRWAPQVARGEVSCARCHKIIQPGEDWDLGHVDGGDPSEYTGPEHRAHNRQTASHAKERRRQVDLPDGITYSEPF
jgi:hypothetical protein